MLQDNLIRTRKLAGKTQEDLALHLNIKRQTYSAYERGISVPDANTLNSIADYFDVSADYLLGREDKQKASSSLDEETLNPKAQYLLDKIKKADLEELEKISDIIDYVLAKSK